MSMLTPRIFDLETEMTYILKNNSAEMFFEIF